MFGLGKYLLFLISRVPKHNSIYLNFQELTVILKNGSLVVSGIDEFTNLLARINPRCHTVDRQPEHLDASAKITNFCEIDIGVLLLNCKIKEFTSWRRDSESSEAFGEARHVSIFTF